MNLKLEFEYSKADIFKDVNALKKQVDAMRPLPNDVEGRVMQKLRLDWNYHSNAIEGNRLNYGETVAFLMEGITAKGKPLKDHLDIRGHNEAINFLLEIVKDTRPISEADIRALHQMILVEPYDSPAKTAEGLPTTKRITLGEYKTSANHVKTATGEIHYYATPEETPAKMKELMEWYEEVERYDIHPIIIAAFFHHKFVEIHPFDDGNGRLSRILMNLILMHNGYPPVVVKMDDRRNYYSLLSRADVGDSWPFVEYVAELAQNSLRLYLKAANGDDINEDEDIDKEIALFQIELENKVAVKRKRSLNQVKHILLESIIPLIQKLYQKISEFDNYFFDTNKTLSIFYSDDVSEIINVSEYGFTPLIDLVKNSTKNFKSFNMNVEYRRFREVNNNFNITITLDFNFEDFEYNIRNYKEAILFKRYDEVLNKAEINNIIMTTIRDIQELMKYNFN